ncbi:tetratricopeptide repeat protein [Agrobacterium sp. 22-226-1]
MINTNDAFANTILNCELTGEPVSKWCQTVAQAINLHNFDDVPYPTTQFLEPSVLLEVSALSGMSVDHINSFEYSLAATASRLKWLLDLTDVATPVQRVNLAAAMASTARYQTAIQVLATVPIHRLYPPEVALYYLIKFAVENRIGLVSSHDDDFAMLKALIDDGELPDHRILDVSAQAIVWNIKTGGVSSSLLKWFVARGDKAVTALGIGRDCREKISLSSYHRAYAMIPAQNGEVAETRRIMRLAEQFAHEADGYRWIDEANVFEARKTVLESSLKEMIHLAKDLDEAERIGLRLIEMDPLWSISYHELAEVYLAQENYAAALKCYEKALEVGLPRLTFSHYMVGACLAKEERLSEALPAFEATLALDPSNISAGLQALLAARRIAPDLVPTFTKRIENWNQQGLLTDAHKEMIA